MFDIRVNDREADEKISKLLGLAMAMSDISFSRWQDGKLLGGVVYNRFTHSSIAMHTGGFTPNWLNREFLWLAFHYPFEQLGVGRVFIMINEKNDHSLHFALKLGFEVETRIRKVYPDGDQIVLVMERHQCRWLGVKPKYLQPIKGNIDGPF